MANKVTFKAEIEFIGDIEALPQLAETLNRLQVVMRPAGWPPGHKNAGCWPLPIDDILDRDSLTEIIDGMPLIKITGIPGGIRDPHLHLGDEVALIRREKFKHLAGKVAVKLAQRLAENSEYIETVGAIRHLVPGAK